jgi:general stress protein 26
MEEKGRFLEDHRWMVLGTSCDDRVTVRTVDYASDRLDIYFLSWQHHTKCEQIRKNPNVASCIDNRVIAQ